MSFYPNIRNNYTFQSNSRLPIFSVPPPPPPPYFTQQFSQRPKLSDQDFLKTFETKILETPKRMKPKSLLISEVREHLRQIVTVLNSLHEKEKTLRESIDSLPEEQWKLTIDDIQRNKVLVEGMMIQINDSYLDVVKSALAKRSAKRLRLKRQQIERKKRKEEMRKKWEEKSRKIDENLRKIQDVIIKTKQEEESKIQADVILKEVTRKKQDAKKCITKLDALIKLRKARQNTAKGSGLPVSETEATSFNNNIEKLKSMWLQKLSLYEKEESELREKLQKDAENTSTLSDEAEKIFAGNLNAWREFLFGSYVQPQVDFKGDIGQFVAVRSQWDEYISKDGTPIPIGWVIPP